MTVRSRFGDIVIPDDRPGSCSILNDDRSPEAIR
jgi:hypothetical protein